jgi:hypothetical protein
MSASSKYHDDLLEGATIKELVKVMLEKSGYVVYSYGYEGPFADVKKKLIDKEAKKSKTVQRIRSCPDLLVYDETEKDLFLVEVKMRRAPKETRVLIYRKLVDSYKEFWNESILVVVVPCGRVFYAQKISELTPKEEYDATTEFLGIEDFFCRISEEDLEHFREKALWSMEKKHALIRGEPQQNINIHIASHQSSEHLPSTK